MSLRTQDTQCTLSVFFFWILTNSEFDQRTLPVFFRILADSEFGTKRVTAPNGFGKDGPGGDESDKDESDEDESDEDDPSQVVGRGGLRERRRLFSPICGKRMFSLIRGEKDQYRGSQTELSPIG